MDPTKEEIAHATTLLQAIPKGWTGLCAIIPIDSVCKFGARGCGLPLRDVVMFQMESDAHALAVCSHHAIVIRQAIDQWREMA